MLRLVFDREDLQRVRLAQAPDPMWELTLSLHRVRDTAIDPRHADWQRRVRSLAIDDDQLRTCLGLLFTLVPPRGNFPDFLTPARLITELDAGCEAIAGTSRTRLERDLDSVFAAGRVPSWVRRLAEGDLEQLHATVAALRTAFGALVTPRWHTIEQDVTADRGHRMHTLVRSGVGAMLAELPGVRGWDGCVLEMPYFLPQTVHLAGRGLTLIPSASCIGKPVTFIDPELPPVLVFPIQPSIANGPPGIPGQHLITLLGKTRAECLSALHVPRNTGELAVYLSLSPSAVSRQTTALRDAGLITSTRLGGSVQHQLTQLGVGLLAGRIPGVPNESR
ncbi:ArsR/SmtB family transcription factor [Sciscionella marina]|uniref:ArsR/SmtB family transcription factor n=1 Tax=Sciscionella marina TaxID=508770 RepID=UPI0003642D9B|nr:helix-turn-helix transcriptional regulator [Sciscionella marina]